MDAIYKTSRKYDYDASTGMQEDVFEKRAAYISKNNELLQKFHFAHPSTFVNVNNIYNTHFYGSTLWNLFSRGTKNRKNMECVTTENFRVTQEDAQVFYRTHQRYTLIIFSISQKISLPLRNPR